MITSKQIQKTINRKKLKTACCVTEIRDAYPEVSGNKGTWTKILRNKRKISWEHWNKSCVCNILGSGEHQNRKNTFRKQGNTSQQGKTKEMPPLGGPRPWKHDSRFERVNLGAVYFWVW